jgi:triacylglycerol lipase
MHISRPQAPVLLLHGIDDTRAAFAHMKQALEQHGHPVLEHDFIPNNGTVALEELATVLKTTIDPQVGSQPIKIVAFSLGGIIARYYLQELDGIRQVSHFISIASPHAGTYTAYFRLGRGVAQLRPGHPFLSNLAQSTDLLRQIETWTIGTPYDLTIIPHISTILFPDRHTVIQSMAHPLLLRNKDCIQTVLDRLDEPLPPSVSDSNTSGNRSD